MKHQVVPVRTGDVVRVHQRIQEGGKSRVQMFEGLVIRTDRSKSLTSRMTVRRIASGVGVEKSFLLHSPLIEKIEVVKRSNVRRNYLTFMRNRSGKSARLAGTSFDKDEINTIEEQQAVSEDAPEQIVNPDVDNTVSTSQPGKSEAPSQSDMPPVAAIEEKT